MHLFGKIIYRSYYRVKFTRLQVVNKEFVPFFQVLIFPYTNVGVGFIQPVFSGRMNPPPIFQK